MPEFEHSPGDLLANVFAPGGSPSTLTILTGSSGSGKSTWCLRLYEHAIAQGIGPNGLISLAIFRDQHKVGFDLLDLSSGRRRRLAVHRQGEKNGGLTTGWDFDVDTLQWGNSVLSKIDNPRLLIIDELGPLEFYSHEGWQAAFPLVAKRSYHWAVVVVRPALLHLAQGRWPWASILDISRGE